MHFSAPPKDHDLASLVTAAVIFAERLACVHDQRARLLKRRQAASLSGPNHPPSNHNPPGGAAFEGGNTNKHSRVKDRNVEATLAALFSRLGDNARTLKDVLEKWLTDLGGPTPNPGLPGCPWDTLFDAEQTSFAFSSTYRMLADAVNCEICAFSFFSYLSAVTTDPRDAAKAEGFANQALGHAALLRVRRRKAYRQRRRNAAHIQFPEFGSIFSSDDLAYGAIAVEELGVTCLREAQREIPDLAPLLAEGQRTVERLKADFPSAKASRSVQAAFDVYGAQLARIRRDGPGLYSPGEYAFAHAEKAFSFYDHIVSKAHTEKVLLMAQELSVWSVHRIETIRPLLGPRSLHVGALAKK